MNNTNKPTRVFYTWRTHDDIVLPACLETNGTYEEADMLLAKQMICQGAPIVSVRRPFTSRKEIESVIADYQRRVEKLPEIKSLETVRYAFTKMIGKLQCELGEW